MTWSKRTDQKDRMLRINGLTKMTNKELVRRARLFYLDCLLEGDLEAMAHAKKLMEWAVQKESSEST